MRGTAVTAYARASQTESGAWRFQALIDHLDGVATRAGAFGASFGAEALAELAGRWHDLGKYAGDFQRCQRRGASKNQARCAETSTGLRH
jgi:CRISPR-associated endonuclease/helicase Cas3